ncbi:MAG: mitochondrial fission ELM1 family protein [Pontiellaceae bacterium]|jgi:mitochondrial fission protein ELM1|nr:mitochondrial fission ELM1 family protein [Pontiellaceae bacterium]
MKVYVLQSKYHGSNQQLLALASVLTETHHIIPLSCEVVSRKRVFYPLYRLLIFIRSRLGQDSSVSERLARWALTDYVNVEAGSFILAKTAPFEFPAAILASGSKAGILFIGRPRRLSRQFYKTLISTPSSPVENADCSLDYLPVSFRYVEFVEARRSLNKEHRIWCVLLGGKARGYDYSDGCWENLLNGLMDRARNAGVLLSISTSPRSGDEVERLLRTYREAYPEVISDTVLWREGDRRKPFDLLVNASCVFVTEDSASMISEALNTRLPVIDITPSCNCRHSLTAGLVEYHCARGSMLRVAVDEISATDVKGWIETEWKPVEECWSDAARRQLLP